MIEKSRLEELIKQGAIVYTLLQGDIEKVDLAKARIFGRTNNYTYIDYWSDTFDQYIETSNERLYEKHEQAEWAAKYHATRTEELNLPTWEEIKNDFDKNFNYLKGFFKISVNKKQDYIIVSNRTVYYSYIFDKPATEENYIKACDLCVKLFKGERDV